MELTAFFAHRKEGGEIKKCILQFAKSSVTAEFIYKIMFAYTKNFRAINELVMIFENTQNARDAISIRITVSAWKVKIFIRLCFVERRGEPSSATAN